MPAPPLLPQSWPAPSSARGRCSSRCCCSRACSSSTCPAPSTTSRTPPCSRPSLLQARARGAAHRLRAPQAAAVAALAAARRAARSRSARRVHAGTLLFFGGLFYDVRLVMDQKTAAEKARLYSGAVADVLERNIPWRWTAAVMNLLGCMFSVRACVRTRASSRQHLQPTARCRCARARSSRAAHCTSPSRRCRLRRAGGWKSGTPTRCSGWGRCCSRSRTRSTARTWRASGTRWPGCMARALARARPGPRARRRQRCPRAARRPSHPVLGRHGQGVARPKETGPQAPPLSRLTRACCCAGDVGVRHVAGAVRLRQPAHSGAGPRVLHRRRLVLRAGSRHLYRLHHLGAAPAVAGACSARLRRTPRCVSVRDACADACAACTQEHARPTREGLGGLLLGGGGADAGDAEQAPLLKQRSRTVGLDTGTSYVDAWVAEQSGTSRAGAPSPPDGGPRGWACCIPIGRGGGGGRRGGSHVQ